MEFGPLIKSRRQSLNLSQEELANRSGISVRNLRDLETGRIRKPRQQTVRLLAEALGLSGDERRDFYERSRAAAGLRSPTDRAGGDSPARPRPAQLPPDTASFTGRTDALAAMDALLSTETPTLGTTILVVGPPGIGKTSLAMHWAHRVKDRFPDGQLFVNLSGFDPSQPPLDATSAAHAFLDALGVPAAAMPVDETGQTGLLRSLLADKRMLLLLDNARDAEHVRLLLVAAPGSVVVITSRDRLMGLVAAASAHPISLTPLSDDESRELLSRRVGAGRLDAEPTAAQVIVDRCGGLPLALAVTAARVVSQPAVPLAVVAGDLTGAVPLLDGLASHDSPTDLRSCLLGSYRLLNPGARQVFRMLGLHPGTASEAAAASLVGRPPEHVGPLLTELARVHLIGETTDHRWHLHDLVAVFARERGRRDSEADHRSALRRLGDHYLQTAVTGARLLEPRREPLPTITPAPGVTVHSLADEEDANAWYRAHRANLVAMVHLTAEHGMAAHAWQLAWAMTTFLSRGGHWTDQLAVNRVALRAARVASDARGMSYALRGLGRAHLRLGDHDAAEASLRRALRLSGRIGDLGGQARAHHGLAYVHQQRHGLPGALYHSRRARRLFLLAGNHSAGAEVLNSSGWYHLLAGNLRQSFRQTRTALILLQRFGERHGEASAWDTLGRLSTHLGDPGQADRCYAHALALFRELGDQFFEAEVLMHRAEDRWAAGDQDAARADWSASARILEGLHHPWAVIVRDRIGRTAPGSSGLA
ncbi:NB-ARC domain-containing protein [Micromonospora sp. NPDC018662]|uniref:NB-ARC domain-containing protein n=1 Tax=Micromonospora sp. NPDC018662 TaxID=3364238 RepID=UPI0037932EC0